MFGLRASPSRSLSWFCSGLVLFTGGPRTRWKQTYRRAENSSISTGCGWHYIDKGSGPTLLLIHGLAGQVLNFTHSLLSRLTHDFRVVILDRPGSGYSLRPDATLAPLAAQARIISRFCQALGLERPVIVGPFARRRDRARSSS